MRQEVDDEMMSIRNGLTDFVVADSLSPSATLPSRDQVPFGRPMAPLRFDRWEAMLGTGRQETNDSFIDWETNGSPQLE